jgi:hypothetical protein
MKSINKESHMPLSRDEIEKALIKWNLEGVISLFHEEALI